MEKFNCDYENHPKLYLNHYFIELRHHIDLNYAKQMFNENDISQKEMLRNVWIKSIEKVNLFEKNCLKTKKNSKDLHSLFLNKTICVSEKAINSIKLIIITDEFVSDIECLLTNEDFKASNILTANKLKLNELKYRINNMNPIDEICLGIKFVQSVKLQFNRIVSIDPSAFRDFSSLNDLNLSSNHLTSIESTTFKGLFELKTLNLANNRLNEIDIGLFNDLKSLETLNLNLNRINSINPEGFRPLTNLKNLDLSYNNIKQIEANTFFSLINLEKLRLSLNEISVIHCESLNGLINLKSLFLDANQIEIIEADSFQKLIKLELLDLHYNWIRKIDIKALVNKLINLKEINLNKNPIVNS